MFLPFDLEEKIRQRQAGQQQQQAPPPGFGGFMGSLAPVQQSMDQMRQLQPMPGAVRAGIDEGSGGGFGAGAAGGMPGMPPKQGISFDPGQRRIQRPAAGPGWSPDFGQMANQVRQRQPGRIRGRGMGRRFNQEEV